LVSTWCIGFEKARARTQVRIRATILDLEREMPTIRACALQQWFLFLRGDRAGAKADG
jgi:hypothetical protein